MGKTRAILFVMLIAPVLLVSGGCANLRLPALDPSGRRLFLPNPNYTTLARDGLLSRLHGGANGGGLLGSGIGNGGFNTGGLGTGPIQQPGPYQPALFNRHRENLRQLFQQSGAGLRNLRGNLHAGTGRLLGGLHQNGRGLFNHGNGTGVGTGVGSLFGNSAYPSVGNPPLCGLNGLAPNGSPCYPMGSPSDSSLAMTLPGAANRIGSGVAGCNSGAQAGMARFAQLGSGVVLAQPRYTARVGEEVVVLGGVQSRTGIVRGGEPVKWSLSNDSVGTIIDAASGAQPRRLLGFLHRASTRNASAAGCGSCVQSTTSDRCRVLPRNPANPQDDIYLSKGQSWVSVTSGSPGRSFVTLAAPQLNSGRRVATAIIDWTDATWECPKPVLSSLEGPAQLITRVFRNSDQQPLSNWLVRYTYVDGPKVTFSTGTDTADIQSDANGRAILDVNPSSTEAGTTRIAVQIYDPDLPAAPVSQCIGFVTWSESEPAGTPLVYPEPPATRTPPPVTVGPPDFSDTPPPTSEPFIPPRAEPEVPRQEQPRNTQLAIRANGPGTANVGGRVRYIVDVMNNGDAVARNVQIWTPKPVNEGNVNPPALRFVGSDDVQPYDGESHWGWDVGDIPPRGMKRITALYDFFEPSEVNNVFSARGQNTAEVQDNAITKITGDMLRVIVSDPRPFQPMVGEKFSHAVKIENRSRQPQDVVLVVKDWTAGIRPLVGQGQPPTSEKGVERVIRVVPGMSEWIEVDFEARSSGPKQFAVTAAVQNSTTEPVATEAFVNVRGVQQPSSPTNNSGSSGQADGRLDVEYLDTMSPGTRERVIVRITNTGTELLTNLRFVYAGDPDLTPVDGTPGYRVEQQNSRRVLVWAIEDMAPEFSQTIEVDIEAAQNPSKRSARNQAEVISDQGTLPKTIEVELQQPNAGPFNTQGGLRIRRAGLRAKVPAAASTNRRVPRSARSDSPLSATITTLPANVQPGEPFEFVVTVANEHPSGFRDLALCLNLPEDIEILDFRGPPMTKTNVSECGRHLNFGTVREILPLEKLTFRAKAVSSQPGNAKTVARVEATGLTKPVIVSTDYQIR